MIHVLYIDKPCIRDQRQCWQCKEKCEVRIMSLGDKRRKFTRMISELVLWIFEQGYECYYGDVKAVTGHKKNSLHYIGLAADLNLFKDGKYLDKTEDHEFAGKKWESMGGAWGGRFQDGNHYSLEYEGMK
jgi:hypothetical protein